MDARTPQERAGGDPFDPDWREEARLLKETKAVPDELRIQQKLKKSLEKDRREYERSVRWKYNTARA